MRGVQGADGLHRMIPQWAVLMDEFKDTVADPLVSEFLNIGSLGKSIASLGKAPRADMIFDTEFRMLMRAIIFRRFLKRNA